MESGNYRITLLFCVICSFRSTLPNGLPGSPTHVGGGHVVSIEKLTPDLTSTTQEAVGPEFFPDDYVESPALFKHGNTYFVTYGSCCCGCSEGGGITVFTAPSVQGFVVRFNVPRRVVSGLDL